MRCYSHNGYIFYLLPTQIYSFIFSGPCARMMVEVMQSQHSRVLKSKAEFLKPFGLSAYGEPLTPPFLWVNASPRSLASGASISE